jgi:hypothetical protein
MVEFIGLGTVSTPLWLLAWSMAGESDAKQRRIASADKVSKSAVVDQMSIRQAA